MESPSQIVIVHSLPLRKPSKRAQSKLTFYARAESAAVWDKLVSNSGVQELPEPWQWAAAEELPHSVLWARGASSGTAKLKKLPAS